MSWLRASNHAGWNPFSVSCWFGFILGCLVTSTIFLFREAHDNFNYDLLLDTVAYQPTAKAVVIKKSMHAVDCKLYDAANDPNNGMEEDPSKFVEKIEPNFWISLHKKTFDPLRWSHIMNKGIYYETEMTEQFKEVLYSKPKGLVVDVGMNIGWYTLYSRAMGHDVVAFDPNPIMHSRVCNSLKLNQWWDGTSDDSAAMSGVTTFAYGLGDQPSTLNFTMARNPGASSFITTGINKPQGTLQVPVMTLDIASAEMGWLQQDNGNSNIIRLLKIDCEGYEPYILRGASKLLNSGNVENIFFESTPKGRGEEVLELFTRLYDAGYFVAHIFKYGDKKDKLNLHLRNGDLEGSDLHTFFSKTRLDMWWKNSGAVQ